MKGVRLWLFLALHLAALSAWGQTQLTRDDVRTIIAQAATRASQVDSNSIIAVVDREGYVLGVWSVSGSKAPNVQFIAGAIARAGTAAFLSSNQNAFTSRTAGYIIQQHFPPMVRDTPPGPLVGVGLSSVYVNGDSFKIGATNKNTGAVTITTVPGVHSDVNFIKQIPLDMTGTFDPNGPLFKSIDPFNPAVPYPALPGARSPGTFGAGIYTGTTHSFTVADAATAATVVATGVSPFGTVVSGTVPPLGPGAIGTSLNDSPGGVPLFKNGELVGGVGVTGDGSPNDESTGFALLDAALPALANLIRGESNNQKTSTPGFKVGADTDEDVALAGQIGYEPSDDILATNVLLGGIRVPYVESQTSLGDVMPLGTIGVPVVNYPIQQSPPPYNYPKAQLGGVDGEIRFPIRGDPVPGRIGKTSRLTAEEVSTILSLAAQRTSITRGAIRLPVGTQMEAFIAVVGNPGRNGTPAPILGVFRTGEATIFSWDVAVQKARTALFFSSNSLAESARTVGFLAQRYYPPGIDGNSPGPFFGLQEGLLITATKAALKPLFFPTYSGKANPYLPNLITIFPGGFPLYRDGVLVGAIGVSGDGVDQDDITGASGCAHFLAPNNIRADAFLYRGARLPYAKFPRDPAVN